MKLNTRSFLGRLMISHVVVIIISLLVIGLIFGYLVQNYYFGLREWKATNNGKRIAKLVSANVTGRNLRSNEIKSARQKIGTIARSANMDIGIANENGEIIFDSTNLADFDLELKAQEIERVLAGNTITKKIRGPDKQSLLMVFPLLQKQEPNKSIVLGPDLGTRKEVLGGIVVRSPLGSISETVWEILRLILYASLIAVIAALGLSFLFASRVTKPLERINESALEIAEGNFERVELPENSSQEIESLVETYNYAVQQVEETLDKKERLEKMRKQFVSDVSHEFRAPLTSLKGFLEIFQEQELSAGEIKNYADIMYKDTEYLEHLIDDLAVLGKLDSGELKLDREVIEAQEIIMRAINSLQHKLKENQLQIKNSFINNVPDLYVDPNRMQQVMINLLDNAIEHSPLGGKIIVKTKYHKGKNSEVEFAIIDQGPGVPEDELDNIWQRFYKVDTARTRSEQGSGLGLAIVKDIIEQHRGRVKVENTKERGAKFSFVLPEDALVNKN